MRRLRLVFLVNGLDIGGAEKIMAKTIRWLDREKFAVTVVALHRGTGGLIPVLEELSAGWVDLGARGTADVRALVRLVKELRHADVVHTFNFHSNILGRILGRLVGVGLILNSEVVMEWESRLRIVVNRATSWLPDLIVCNAEAVREYVVAELGAAPRKVVTVYQGLDVRDYAVDRPARKEVVVGTVARLSPQKGYPYLLETIRLLRPANPEIKWLFFGAGPDRQKIEAEIKTCGLEGYVCLRGSSFNMSEILCEMDLYAHAAIAEGLPYAVMEAMASGLAVVATDVGGMKELVEDGVTGILVPARKPKMMADAIQYLLDRPGERGEMGRRGRERIRRLFNEKHMAFEEERLIGLHFRRPARTWGGCVSAGP